jgi:hypothetical protein
MAERAVWLFDHWDKQVLIVLTTGVDYVPTPISVDRVAIERHVWEFASVTA